MSKKKRSEDSSETLGFGRIVFMAFSYILIAVILLGGDIIRIGAIFDCSV